MFIKQADEGDETALSEIQELLDSSPTEGITALGGDLAQRAERALVERIAGEQLGFREGILAKLEMLRTELAGPRPTPIERLLVERVVACWLQVYHADAIAAQAENVAPVMGDYNQRRQDRAHRRFLSAIRALATVRRLALPTLVAVNVTGMVETKDAGLVQEARPNLLPASKENAGPI